MFDAYHKWLGIPKGKRPPSYYQLLGISSDEQDPEVIEAAALRQVAFVRNFQAGAHAEVCSLILTELAQARLTLLNPTKRAQYDASLRAAVEEPPAAPDEPRSASPAEELAALGAITTSEPREPQGRPARAYRDGEGSLPRRAPLLSIAASALFTLGLLAVAWRWIDGKTRVPPAPPTPPTLVTPAKARPRGAASASPRRPLEVVKASEAIPALTAVDPATAFYEVIYEPIAAQVRFTGEGARVVGSAPGRLLLRVIDPDQSRPLQLELHHERFKPLVREILPRPGARVRTHVELAPMDSSQASSYWWTDGKNLVPFPMSPLELPPSLRRHAEDKISPALALLEILVTPATARIETQGMEVTAEGVRNGHGLYRFPDADGTRTVRIAASGEDRKPVVKTVLPLPGERRTLRFTLEPIDSPRDSSAVLGGVTCLPPSAPPEWAEYRVRLDPQPKSCAWRTSGLSARSYYDEPRVHHYQIPDPDGRAAITFHYSGNGYKPLDVTVTPRPGERRDLIFRLVPSDSSEESRIVDGTADPGVTAPTPTAPPAPPPVVKMVNKELRRMEGAQVRIATVAVTPEGKRGVSAGLDGQIRVYDLETGRIVRRMQANRSPVLCLAISPNGRQLLSAGDDHMVRLWDVVTGRFLSVLAETRTPVRSVGFTPIGELPWVGDASAARVWNAAGAEIGSDFGSSLERPLVALEVTGDGSRAYMISGNDILLFKPRAQTLDRRFGRFSGGMEFTTLDVSPDGQLLIAGSSDGTLYLWDIALRKEIRKIGQPGKRINSVAFSPDGKTVVAAGGDDDYAIRLWDVNTGAEIARFVGHTERITRALFTRDGQRLLSGSLDRTVRLWEIPH